MGGIRLQSNKPAKGSASQKASLLVILVVFHHLARSLHLAACQLNVCHGTS